MSDKLCVLFISIVISNPALRNIKESNFSDDIIDRQSLSTCLIEQWNDLLFNQTCLCLQVPFCKHCFTHIHAHIHTHKIHTHISIHNEQVAILSA